MEGSLRARSGFIFSFKILKLMCLDIFTESQTMAWNSFLRVKQIVAKMR